MKKLIIILLMMLSIILSGCTPNEYVLRTPRITARSYKKDVYKEVYFKKRELPPDKALEYEASFWMLHDAIHGEIPLAGREQAGVVYEMGSPDEIIELARKKFTDPDPNVSWKDTYTKYSKETLPKVKKYWYQHAQENEPKTNPAPPRVASSC